jgi:hypothetical protein
MSFFKDIWADIVDKRLWPVVVVLVLAMVGIPVALGRGGGAEEAPSSADFAPPAAKVEEPAKTVVRLQAPKEPTRATGRPKNPFHQQGPKPAATTSVANTPAAPTTAPPGNRSDQADASLAAAGTPAPSAPAASPPAATPPATPSQPVTQPQTQEPTGYAAGYRVDLSFGQAGSADTYRDSVRLRALRTGTDPLAVFMGVRRDKPITVFLLAPGVTATGDGRCLPAPMDCQVLELRKGESEFFDVARGSAGIVQYELDVDRILVRRAETKAAAERARKRESRSGRKLMFSLARQGQGWLGHYMYSADVGTLDVRPVKVS